MGTLTIDLNRWVDRTGEFMFIFSPDKGVHCKLGADDLAFSIEPTVCTPCRPGSVGRTVSIDSFLKECMVCEALEGTLQTMTTRMRRMAVGSWLVTAATLLVSYRLPSTMMGALSMPSAGKRMQDNALVEGVESRPMLKPRLCSRVSAIMVIPPLPPLSP